MSDTVTNLLTNNDDLNHRVTMTVTVSDDRDIPAALDAFALQMRKFANQLRTGRKGLGDVDSVQVMSRPDGGVVEFRAQYSQTEDKPWASIELV